MIYDVKSSTNVFTEITLPFEFGYVNYSRELSSYDS